MCSDYLLNYVIIRNSLPNLINEHNFEVYLEILVLYKCKLSFY